MSFESLGLRAELLSAIAAQGYTTPTPIQTAAIPVIFEGCDLLAGAQTGTGKTAAFALPIVQMLAENIPKEKRRKPRALVLVPTRELAAQVSEQMNNFARRLSLRSTMIYGGVTIQAQIDRLHRGVDIVVATPGRLLDHAERGTVNLSTDRVSGAGRGRPHARSRLYRRHPEGGGVSAGKAPDPALFGNLFARASSSLPTSCSITRGASKWRAAISPPTR